MRITALIAAGGKGTRMGADVNKVFLKLGEREILYYTIAAFENNKHISSIIIVTGREDMEKCRSLVSRYKFKKVSCIAEGGATRQQSVMNGLEKADCDIVLIHDGARALIAEPEINRLIEDCIAYGAAAAGVRSKDTLKTADDKGFIAGTINRETTYNIQTPQVFYLDTILDLHKRAKKDGFEATDDCMIAEHYGVAVKITAGAYDNIKLTTPDDLIVGENIIKRRNTKYENRKWVRRSPFD